MIRILKISSILIFLLLLGNIGLCEEHDNESAERKVFPTKIILGLSSCYLHYPNLRDEVRLEVDDKFLIGFNLGFSVKGLVFNFVYSYNILPSEGQLGETKVIDCFDTYMCEFSYIFTIINNYLYLGPTLGIALDTSTLKFFNQFDFSNFLQTANVKHLVSKTLSLGIGVRTIGLKNIMLSGFYFYSFPNIYFYQDIPINNSPIFRPMGPRVILTLCF
ncbi:MAG: hypothetical protein ABDH28_04150 [Brevinematia bacterium]